MSSVDSLLTLFLGGDVMTGRGVDQVLPHPGDPRIQEPHVRSAETYVQLAEQANGRIPRPVDFSYVWGDALQELASRRPDARIVNFETTITRSDDHWKGKGIHYRMHPDNVPCITAAHIDCGVLANNHALDYRYAGLLETLDTLKTTGVRIAGAGRNLAEARAPAVIEVPSKGRVNFRLNRASRADAGWLRDTINRESRRFDFRVELREDDRFELRRSRPSSGLGRQA